MTELAKKEPTSPEANAERLTTVHLYYNDTQLYTNTGRVTGQWETEMNGEKRVCLVLDRTVMHPQGGQWSGRFSVFAQPMISL